MLTFDQARRLIDDQLRNPFRKERERLDRIDNWMRWDHAAPHQPHHTTREYKELSLRSQTPWLGLIVTSVAQNLYVDRYRPENSIENSVPWEWWQANGLDARQMPIHRAALGYGHSYVTVIPGEDDFGDDMPVIRGHSPRRMMAFYAEPESDDWPMYALRMTPARLGNGHMGNDVRLYDAEAIYFLQADTGGNVLQSGGFDPREHGMGRCPVVRFTNQLDLEGRTPGEVEPLIPIAGRIDQTVFDRLVVQRFASWIVRTVSGMAMPDTAEDAELQKMILRAENLLIAEDQDTKFGSLPATPLEGFIKANQTDIQQLAAVSQTPVYELLGDLINLSADALEAARASLSAKVEERQQGFGESWEQTFRLAGAAMGDDEAARDLGSQVGWRDTSVRTMAQAADALGKLATMLGVPVEMLWERIPGFSQQDVERAKTLIEEGGAMAELTSLLQGAQAETGGDTETTNE